MLDYAIVGCGPSGLTLAYLLGKHGKKVAVLDMNKEIGGCHRVTRVDGFFTEHGPRIYMSGFVNTKNILNSMDLSFHELFTSYDFGLASGINIFKTFSIREYLILAWSFLKLSFNKDYRRRQSVHDFATYHNFSKTSLSQMDKLCRLTDGADAKRFSIHEFLNLLNQNMFYGSHQPVQPNDIGLFSKMLPNINADILTSTYVKRLNLDGDKIKSLNTNNKTIYAKNYILAIPPKDIHDLLERSDIIMPMFDRKFVTDSLYDQYIPITYHWDRVVEVPKLWGFPESDWGVIVVVLSDYMKFDNPKSKTVMSVCISLTDTKSKKTGKTCNETDTEADLIFETFRQVQEKYGTLPRPTRSILHPKVKRIQNKWIEGDTAYMATPKSTFVPFETKISNLYNVGTHNGNSDYVFTSMESAVTNAIILFNKLLNFNFPVKSLWALTDVLHIIYALLSVFIFHRLATGKWLPSR